MGWMAPDGMYWKQEYTGQQEQGSRIVQNIGDSNSIGITITRMDGMVGGGSPLLANCWPDTNGMVANMC